MNPTYPQVILQELNRDRDLSFGCLPITEQTPSEEVAAMTAGYMVGILSRRSFLERIFKIQPVSMGCTVEEAVS